MAAPGADVAGGRDPGWFPDRMNPNVQKYWDGNGWTAQRRWVAGQWQLEPLPGVPWTPAGPGVAAASGSFAAPGMGAPPMDSGYYAYGGRPHQSRFVPPTALAQRPIRTAAPVTSVSFSQAALLLCSVLLIVGAFTPWVTTNAGPLHFSISGTLIPVSINYWFSGWLTVAAGVAIGVMTLVDITSEASGLRTAMFVVALVALVGLAYDLIRMIQAVQTVENLERVTNLVGAPRGVPTSFGFSASIGWGLILAVIAAVGAALFATTEWRRS